MLTLFHAPFSRSGRTLWLLEELGTPFNVHQVTIARQDGSGRRDPANVHPEGKVPALTHNGTIVTESLAIALYLTETFPTAGLGVTAQDADRAAYLTWMCWITGEMEPAFLVKMHGAPTMPQSQAAFDAVIARVREALKTGPYLMGERFTAVDVMAGATLLWGRAHLPAAAALDDYLARLTARPAQQRAMARDVAATKAA